MDQEEVQYGNGFHVAYTLDSADRKWLVLCRPLQKWIDQGQTVQPWSVLVGGLSAYLLYALGFLRPEQWLSDSPGLLVTRLSIALLVFLFGLGAYVLSSMVSQRRPASQK